MARFDNNRFKTEKQTWETPDELFDLLNKDYHRECAVRYNAIDVRGHREEKEDMGRSNMQYWHGLSNKFFTDNCVIDWNLIKDHPSNFIRFKEIIDEEYLYTLAN